MGVVFASETLVASQRSTMQSSLKMALSITTSVRASEPEIIICHVTFTLGEVMGMTWDRALRGELMMASAVLAPYSLS